MGEGTAANVIRQIEKITAWMSDLDLRISAHEYLASMKKLRPTKRLPLLKTGQGMLPARRSRLAHRA
jgi:hypothetical protein